MSAAAATTAAAAASALHPPLRFLHRPLINPPPLLRFSHHIPSSSSAVGGSHRRKLASSIVVAPNAARGVPDRHSLDEFLSVAEVLCLAPSLVLALCAAVACLLPRASPKLIRIVSGNAWISGQLILLSAAVFVGGLIRQRQLQRSTFDSRAPESDFLRRIEKVEEDLHSSATVVRVLSRQLEKLGIRFRVTRRTLKDPISKAAALAQKNSEATRALALQADMLEKELKEIQMVLLSMQEQQQKQLDLILAVAKAAKLFETTRTAPSGQNAAGKINFVHGKNEMQPVDVQIGNNDNF